MNRNTVNMNRNTVNMNKADAKALPAKSITSSMEWQQAMIAYCDRCVEFSQTEEDTPQAEAAGQAMIKAFDKVGCIVDCFFT